MTQIIDRRINGKNKSAVNRQRFLRRFRQQIKKAVSDAVDTRSITEIDHGEKINIPTKDTHEPIFGHGPGGRRDAVHPGNKEFTTGDRIKRPPSGGGGGGSEASDSGEGEDEFAFQLSREEFLEFFFEDLELPDLVKTQLSKVTDFKTVRAGYSTSGVPTNIDIVRSLTGALARRLALHRGAPRTQPGPRQDRAVLEEVDLSCALLIQGCQFDVDAGPSRLGDMGGVVDRADISRGLWVLEGIGEGSCAGE